MTKKETKQNLDRIGKIRDEMARSNNKIYEYLVKIEDTLFAEEEAVIAQTKPPLVVTKAKKK